MKYALVNSKNCVLNLIEWDGNSKYELSEGCSLKEVKSWVRIGDDADCMEPPQPLPEDPEVLKKRRNELAKYNMAIVACFNLSKKDNPELTFSGYLDSLEKESANL